MKRSQLTSKPLKKSRKPLKQKSEAKKVIDKADRALQDYYRTLHLNCEVCGVPADLVHHWVEKSQSSFLRFNPINLVPLCRGCHFRHHNCGDTNIVRKILEVRGEEWADQVNKLKIENKGYKIDYEKELEKWTNEIQS